MSPLIVRRVPAPLPPFSVSVLLVSRNWFANV